jgi:solute:Na+ symporter, SSS family
MVYNVWDILPVFLAVIALLFIVGRSAFKPADIDAFAPEKIKVGWFVIGMSLVATDVSLAYIIGTAGVGYQKGLAVGSYGWTASLVMIVVALYILPKLMRVGIKTLPEYLELRFSPMVRLVVALIFLFFIVGVVLSSVFFSFAFMITQVFSLDAQWFVPIIWTVGILSGLILFSNGIEQAMKLDVIIAVAMLLAGCFVVAVCIYKIGGFQALTVQVPEHHLSSMLSKDDDFLPWTQVAYGFCILITGPLIPSSCKRHW